MSVTRTPSAFSPAAWRWALVQTRRDLRSASMRFLLVAVVLAVAALSAVAFFADRIEGGLNRDAAQLLGATWWWWPISPCLRRCRWPLATPG